MKLFIIYNKGQCDFYPDSDSELEWMRIFADQDTNTGIVLTK
jgi:hypothetical protein